MIRKFKDIQESLIEMREKGNPRGENTGFACLDEFYSVKEGSIRLFLHLHIMANLSLLLK
jgi:hypothetical protein